VEVYTRLIREAAQAQYFVRALRPDYEVTVIPKWLAESRRFVDASNGTFDAVNVLADKSSEIFARSLDFRTR